MDALLILDHIKAKAETYCKIVMSQENTHQAFEKLRGWKDLGC